MKHRIRSRINWLNRFTMISVLLVAALFVLASRLPGSQTSQVSNSPIHAGRELAVGVTQQVVSPTPPAVPSTPSATALPATAVPVEPSPTPDVSNRIGILAGHWGYDTGAICADGLREVDITLDIAQRVAAQLRALGYEVDLLQEQDPDTPEPPLQNYQAAAFLSLHVDSCIPGASGFKVSRWASSQMPEVEDRLVQCLYDRYGAITGLTRHESSITIDMWNYYAFREIGELTPGAIIEMGFMTGDRWLLVHQPDLIAQGIVSGLLCFLEDSTGN